MSNVNLGQNVDFHLNQALNLVVQVLASDPSSPATGQFWYNSTSKVLKYYDGTAIQTLSDAVIVDASTTAKGITKLSVAPVSSTNPIAAGDNDPRMTDSRTPTGSAGGDLSGTYPNPTVASIGGKTSSQVATAVNEAHNQNTDTGTTQTSFQVDSGNSGPKIKNNSGVLEVRNSADSAYADLKANNIYVNGELIEVTGTTVLVGDSFIRLNDQITVHGSNSDAGINIKRLASDDTTRVDAKINYNESGGYWQEVIQDPGTGTATITRRIPGVYAADVGDNSSTSFNISHKLGTLDVLVQVFKKSTGDTWDVGVTRSDTSTVQLTFATAPATNEYRVVITG